MYSDTYYLTEVNTAGGWLLGYQMALGYADSKELDRCQGDPS